MVVDLTPAHAVAAVEQLVLTGISWVAVDEEDAIVGGVFDEQIVEAIAVEVTGGRNRAADSRPGFTNVAWSMVGKQFQTADISD